MEPSTSRVLIEYKQLQGSTNKLSFSFSFSVGSSTSSDKRRVVWELAPLSRPRNDHGAPVIGYRVSILLDPKPNAPRAWNGKKKNQKSKTFLSGRFVEKVLKHATLGQLGCDLEKFEETEMVLNSQRLELGVAIFHNLSKGAVKSEWVPFWGWSSYCFSFIMFKDFQVVTRFLMFFYMFLPTATRIILDYATKNLTGFLPSWVRPPRSWLDDDSRWQSFAVLDFEEAPQWYTLCECTMGKTPA